MAGSRRMFSLASTVALVFIGAAPLGPQRHRDEEAAIRSARLGQNAALAARDMDGAARTWADNIVVTSGLGLAFSGAASYRRAFELDSGFVYERTPDRIQVSTPWTLAWEDGTWTGRRSGSPTPPLLHGRYSAMWAKIGVEWKIRSELFVAISCSGQACRWPISLR